MWPRRGPGPLTRPAKKGDGCRGGRRRQDGLRHRGKRRRRGGWAVGGKAPRPPPQPRVEGGKPIKAQGSAQTGVLHQTRTTRDVSGAHGSARIGGTVKRADSRLRQARRSGLCPPIRPVRGATRRPRRAGASSLRPSKGARCCCRTSGTERSGGTHPCTGSFPKRRAWPPSRFVRVRSREGNSLNRRGRRRGR